MSRLITVAACQLGPIQKSDRRATIVKRLIALLRQAAERRCDLDLARSYKARPSTSPSTGSRSTTA